MCGDSRAASWRGFISMLMPCGGICALLPACYYAAVYFMVLTVMSQWGASLRAGLCHNVKQYCCLHLPCEVSAPDRTVFIVTVQQPK